MAPSDFSEKGLIIAQINAKPGKGQDIINAYNDFIKTLKERELDSCPEFLLYHQVDAETSVERLYTVEKFQSLDDVPFHRANPALDVFNKVVADGDLVLDPIRVAVCEPVIGFEKSGGNSAGMR